MSALKPLRLNFSNSSEQILCTNLCFLCAGLADWKDLRRCGVGSPCNLRAFHLWSLAGNASSSAFINICRFQKVVPLVPCTPVQETLITGALNVLQYLSGRGTLTSFAFDPCIHDRIKLNALMLYLRSHRTLIRR